MDPLGKRLVRAIVSRVVGAAGTLIAVVFLMHAALALAPGDPLAGLPPEARATLAAAWHLDEPAWQRPVRATAAALTGDLGVSVALAPGVPARTLLVAPALRSAGWAVSALTLAVVTALGLAAWTRAGRAPSRVVRAVAHGVSVLPMFLLAHTSISAINAATFALMGAGVLGRPAWFALPLEDHPARAALAVVLLGVGSGTLSDLHREVEVAAARVHAAPFVRAAIARGDPTLWLRARHMVGPVASLVRGRVPIVLAGLVVVERVTLSGGVGALLWDAVLTRDAAVAVAATALLAAIGMLVSLGCDLARMSVDPRTWAET
jgi:ABC-type dipeptide/oligopeptide/nickel transport system permease component